MKYFKLKQIALALVMVVLAVSCIEDSEPTPMRYTAYGFINKVADTYYVNIDGGMKVELQPFSDSELKLKGNDRILFQFTVEEEYEVTAPVRYLVNVVGMMIVDYSQIVTLNDVSRDTIGKGMVSLEYNYESDLNPVDNYLNLSVRYQKQEGNHVFSLCYDPEAQEEGQPVILELKNKRPVDKESGQIVRTYQSYNISQLRYLGELNSENKMEFILRINSGDSQKRDFKLTYAPIQK